MRPVDAPPGFENDLVQASTINVPVHLASASSPVMKPAPVITPVKRTKFPETWIFDMFSRFRYFQSLIISFHPDVKQNFIFSTKAKFSKKLKNFAALFTNFLKLTALNNLKKIYCTIIFLARVV